MTYLQFLKKHWLATLILFTLPIVLLVVFLMFFGKSIYPSNWLEFVGTILVYYGTTSLSSVALFQSSKSNEISEKSFRMSEESNRISEESFKISEKSFLLSERMYSTIFAIDSAQKCISETCTANKLIDKSDLVIHFCDVDSMPSSCVGYRLLIHNYCDHPIISIEITTKYTVGRQSEESITKSSELLIPPNTAVPVFICNTPRFEELHGYVHLKIVCTNVFGNKTTETIQLNDDNVESGENVPIKYIRTSN